MVDYPSFLKPSQRVGATFDDVLSFINNGQFDPQGANYNMPGYLGQQPIPTSNYSPDTPITQPAMMQAFGDKAQPSAPPQSPSPMAYAMDNPQAADAPPPQYAPPPRARTRIDVAPRVPDIALPEQITPGASSRGAPANNAGFDDYLGLPKGYDLGGRLQDVGAVLLGMNNPELSKSLIASRTRQATDANQWEVIKDEKSGALIRVHKPSGRVDVIRNPLHNREPTQVDTPILKDLSASNANYASIYNSAQTAAELKDAMDRGLIDPSLWGMTKAAAQSAFGDTSPQMQMYNKLQAFRTQMASDQLRLNTGTQTDRDFQAAKDSLVSTFGSMDPKSFSKALGDYVDRAGKTAHSSYRDMVDSYKANNPNAPTGVFAPYEKAVADQGRFYSDFSSRRTKARPPLSSFRQQ